MPENETVIYFLNCKLKGISLHILKVLDQTKTKFLPKRVYGKNIATPFSVFSPPSFIH